MAMVAIYSKKLYVAERETGAMLRKFRLGACDAIAPILDGIEDDQVMAVQTACTNPICIVYGPPGTGKTTTVRRIVQSFDRAGMKGVIATPTGKAAKRSDEVLSTDGVNYIDRPACLTTFRALGFNQGKYEFNYHNRLPHDYVILEESSMESMEDFRNLLYAIDPSYTRLIIVGDPYQLPSIGAGNILYDLIHSNKIPKIELRKIYRQGANSGIVFNASRILKGMAPLKEDPVTGEKFTDFFFVPTKDEDESMQKITEWVCEKLPAKMGLDSTMDIQPLSPGRKSIIGTDMLNTTLRARLNPSGRKGFRDFRIGDKVINKKNRYAHGIVNGDVGIVRDLTEHGMEVDFGLEQNVVIDRDMGDSIYLAYAYTVHGSQGSEYPCCIMPLHRCHYQLLFQNLVYTGMTRGKRMSLIVGDSTAFDHAISNTVTDKRRTGLKHWL